MITRQLGWLPILMFLSVCCASSANGTSLAPGALPTAEQFLHRMTSSVINSISSVLEPRYDALLTLQEEDSEPAAETDLDISRNVSQIIQSRGFICQEFDVTTRDGYILTIQRILNPLVDPESRSQLKPVLLQHGLMTSSADWVLNSQTVKPEPYPNEHDNSVRAHLHQNYSKNLNQDADQEHPRSLGFYLANRGYDVFLANSRGNVYGQRHVNMSSWDLKFWDFSWDEQIEFDLPDTIEFVLRLTNKTHLGYVGHSQGTTMIFGLLADRPEYAFKVEPVIALAPIAYVNNCLSPVRHFAYYTPVFQHVNFWFFTSNAVVRYLEPRICQHKTIRKEICENILFLSSGYDETEFNETRTAAFLAHMQSGTSVKNVAHWGQAVLSGRFAHFDHGILGNQIKYGQAQPPDYELASIKSRSIVLFSAENDWLASPKDVARLKADLKVPLLEVFNVTKDVASWNHIDFVYAIDCGRIINRRILEIFDKFS